MHIKKEIPELLMYLLHIPKPLPIQSISKSQQADSSNLSLSQNALFLTTKKYQKQMLNLWYYFTDNNSYIFTFIFHSPLCSLHSSFSPSSLHHALLLSPVLVVYIGQTSQPFRCLKKKEKKKKKNRNNI